ncbi:MAG: PLP-dependent aminotransferase family protein [Actinobacteria bacterium]|nr:PLP-dependent aminotransferase family protein [Actinomycetota bacterium]
MQPPVETQNVLRDGFVEFAYGDPDPAVLPVELLREAADRLLRRSDAAGALAYGPDLGPRALRDAIVARSAEREGLGLGADQILVSGGNSQALGQVLTDLTRPGDAVFVEIPTYSLALGVLADHPVEVNGVPMDDAGLDVDALEEAVRRARGAGRRARLLYTVPTFHNPAGVSLALERRESLLELARREGLILVEDDVYRELVFEGQAPPALRALDPEAPVVRLGSFAKTLAPGLRVGWIDAPPELFEIVSADGVLESGGCVSQFSASLVAALLEAGVYDDHVVTLRRTYAARRDALAGALRKELPAGCSFTVPAGGFFLWVRLPRGLTASKLLPVAERHRVGLAPGHRFCIDGDDRHLRLPFSLYDAASLAEGARRLAAAIGEAMAGAS